MAASTPKTVHEAFGAVMADLRAIEKGDQNTQTGPGGGYRFRGIDAVMMAVGPVLRTHGVFIIPTPKDLRSESYQSRNGAQMRNVTVEMQYRVYGPGGDYFDGGVYGEAADAGDKAVTKAQSVAYRTFLLQSLTVPTGDPDPDASSHERAAQAPARTDLDEALDELGDACAGIGLAPADASAKFFAKYKKPPRAAGAEKVREFIATLLAAAPDPNQTQLPVEPVLSETP